MTIVKNIFVLSASTVLLSVAFVLYQTGKMVCIQKDAPLYINCGAYPDEY